MQFSATTYIQLKKLYAIILECARVYVGCVPKVGA